MVGDIVKIEGGMEVTGDGVVIEANSVTVDESPMTGETKPMKKNTISFCNNKKKELLSIRD